MVPRSPAARVALPEEAASIDEDEGTSNDTQSDPNRVISRHARIRGDSFGFIQGGGCRTPKLEMGA